MKRILIVTDVHYCQLEYGGISREEKAELLISHIRAEYEREPFEFILFLGDYSLDHWAWNSKGTWVVRQKSYTRELIERYFDKLPTPYYMLPGNHEQYGEELWREITGMSRESELIVDDFLFVLWDSYGAELDPDYHSDGKYTAPNVAKIRALMDAHPDKRVILCSHWFIPCGSEEEKALITDERVVCLFVGHSHSSKVLTLPEEYGLKKMIQAGAWVAGEPDSKEAWGVRDLYLEENKIVSRYIVPDYTLYVNGEAYDIPAHCRDGVELPLSAVSLTDNTQ